jgi:hypothetical protein
MSEQTHPAPGDVYAPRGEADASDLVTVAEIADGTVKFFPRGGGFRYAAPAAEFEARMRFVSAQELKELSRPRPGWFGGDWFAEGAEPMAGYSTGAIWNGWACPLFERHVVEAALADDRIGGDGLLVAYDEGRDAFLVASNVYGEPLPEGFGAADIAAALDAGETAIRRGDAEIELEECGGRDYALADGRTVRLYGVCNNNWCWNELPAPEPKSAPGPR